jgi:AcrR family transcriptional regulator
LTVCYKIAINRLVPQLRRTQEERSAATRARLLDATVACLSERGWARTTTTEIADRAGVSRGAQLHHFPTKAELVTTAVEHLFMRRNEEFRAAFAELPADAPRGPAAVELLWSMMRGPTFHAWLELVVAARTDAALAHTVRRIGDRFTDNVRQTFLELFPRPADAPPLYDLAPAVTFALLQGLALDHIVVGDDPRLTAVVALWKQLAQLIPGGHP